MMSSPADRSQPTVHKKLRSKLPQRKRCRWHLSPPLPSLSLTSSVSVVSLEESCFGGKEAANNAKKLRAKSGSINRGSGHQGSEVTELSESSTSWSESSSGAVKRQEDRIPQQASGENEPPASIAPSEVSCVHQHSPTKSGEFSSKLSPKVPENLDEKRSSVELQENDVVSVTSAVEFCYDTDAISSLQKEETKRNGNKASEFESSFGDSTAVSTVDQKTKRVDIKYDSDLTCTEQLTNDDVPDYSSCFDESFSDLQTQIVLDSSDYEFSCSPYFSSDSGSQFSEKSSEDSTPSHTFALLLQYREQFLRSGTALPLPKGTSTIIYEDEAMRSAFVVEEDALSYQMLRNRERRQVLPWNSSEEVSEFIMDRRSRMIHWIIEHSRTRKLQKETLFLAASIFDRFLKAGSFKSSRNFEIAGIASLALATRIEENQPYNSVRQTVFSVGRNVYGRCEVVAMEWLMQEALSFQFSSPTVYNFLWFYLKSARANDLLIKKVKDLGELALMDHELICFWPSTVAAALVILACPEDAAAQQVIVTHVRTQDDDLPKCIESLQWLIKYIC